MRAKHVAWTLAIIPVLHGQAPMPGNPKIQVQILVDISGSVKHVNPLRIAADLVGRLDTCDCVTEGSVGYEIDLMAGRVEQRLASHQLGAESNVRALARDLDDFRLGNRDHVAGLYRADLNKTDFSRAFDAVGKFLRVGAGPDVPRKVVWLISDGEHDPRNGGARERAPFSHLREKATVPFDLFLIYTGSMERMASVKHDWEKGTSGKGLQSGSQAPWIHFVFEENNLQHLEEELIDRAIIQPVFTLEDADCTAEPADEGDLNLHIVAMTKMDPSLVKDGSPPVARACWEGVQNCAKLDIESTSTIPETNPRVSVFGLRLYRHQQKNLATSFTLDLQRPDLFHWSPWIWRTVACHPQPWMRLDAWSGAPYWVVNPFFRAEFQAVDAAHPENSSTMQVTAVINSPAEEPTTCSVVTHEGRTEEELKVGHPVNFSGPVTVLCPLGRQNPLLPGSQRFPVSFQLNDTTPIPIGTRGKRGRGVGDDLTFVWLGWVEHALLLVAILFLPALFIYKTFRKGKWETCTQKTCICGWLFTIFAVVCVGAIALLQYGDGVLEILKSPLYNSSVCRLYWFEWFGASLIAVACVFCSWQVRAAHPRLGTGLLLIPFSFALVGFGLVAIAGFFLEEAAVHFLIREIEHRSQPNQKAEVADAVPPRLR
jgi:hypothetical protein